MKKEKYQWHYEINGLIPKEVRLRRKIWLRNGSLVLEKKGEQLNAFLLGDDNSQNHIDDEVVRYLSMSCLISHNSPDLISKGGCSLRSVKEFGKKSPISASITISKYIPYGTIPEIEKYAPEFIRTIKKVCDKYVGVVQSNGFLSMALDYFYDGRKKVYEDEGFMNTMISLESLLNEGTSDIKYKISCRLALLLGLCGLNDIEVFENTKKIYNYRSRLVHGDRPKKNDSDIYLGRDYVRRAIIAIMILLKNESRQNLLNNRKVKILEEIDHAILDEKRRKILEREIKIGLKDFKLKIPRYFEAEEDGKKYGATVW
jgi:hypothetical protein